MCIAGVVDLKHHWGLFAAVNRRAGVLFEMVDFPGFVDPGDMVGRQGNVNGH